MKNLHDIRATDLSDWFRPGAPLRLADYQEEWARYYQRDRRYQDRIEGVFIDAYPSIRYDGDGRARYEYVRPDLISDRIIRYREQMLRAGFDFGSAAYILSREDYHRLQLEVRHDNPLMIGNIVDDRGFERVYDVPIVVR